MTQKLLLIASICLLFVSCRQPDTLPERDAINLSVRVRDTVWVMASAQSAKNDTAWVRIPALPQAMKFAGEDVPLHYYDVYESLQRELTILCYWHATMSYILQLSGRYFPVIQPILQAEGVPEDFIYLCVAESSLQNVVSPAGAAGFWQFMKPTAKQYHLEVNDNVDERYNLEKATKAACAYLKASYQKYGSWTLAAAAYNMGEGNTNKRIRGQMEENYYNMHLPVETGRYVFRILAFKLLMTNPEKYGYSLSPDDYYKPLEYKEVEVRKSISSLSDFARSHHSNLKLLRMANPWIRDNHLTVRNGTYRIKILKEKFRTHKFDNN